MKLGRYQVIREIGQGGMATAYLALAPGGQKVVLKTPHLNNDDLNDRLRDEARVGIRLAHPALVETLDLFEHKGKPVLVVAFIDGVSVDALRRRAPLAAASVARIGWQIAQGLHVVHTATDERGRALHMVHRDVTAPNVLVDKHGDARLIDLGIARSVENLAATEPGTIKGTVRYLAPELLQGLPPTPKSDLWGLGCVLFEAATGRPIHEGAPAQTMISILRTHPLEKPEAAQLDEKLREVLALIFEKDPEKRIGDGLELAAHLERVEAELGDAEAALSAVVIDAVGEQGEDEVAAAQAVNAPVEAHKLPQLTGTLLEEPSFVYRSGPSGGQGASFIPFPPVSSDPFAEAGAKKPPAPSPFAGGPPPVGHSPFAPVPPTGTVPSAPPGAAPPTGAARLPEIPKPEPRWSVPPPPTTSAFSAPVSSAALEAAAVEGRPGDETPETPHTPGTPITSPTPIPGIPNPLLAGADLEVEERPRKQHSNIMRVEPRAAREAEDEQPSVLFVYARRVLVIVALAVALGLLWHFAVKPRSTPEATTPDTSERTGGAADAEAQPPWRLASRSSSSL